MDGDILVIRLSSLGDVLLTLPALHALRARHPGARIHLVTREAYAPLFAADPVIDAVVALPGETREPPRELRARRWALVVDLQSTGRSRRIVGLLRADRVVTAARDRAARWRLVARARMGLGEAGPAGTRAAAAPVWRRFVECAGVRDEAGAREMLRRARLRLDEGARLRARRWLEERAAAPSDRRVAILPGASHPVKSWPPERFGAVGRALSAGGGCGVVVLGGEADRASACIAAAASGGAPAWCGDDDLPLLAAILETSAVALSNDSGLGHLAAALQVPVVTLYGPTVPAFGFAPHSAGSRVLERRMGCRPCSLHGTAACRVGTHACMRSIDAGEVLAEISAVLRGRVST